MVQNYITLQENYISYYTVNNTEKHYNLEQQTTWRLWLKITITLQENYISCCTVNNTKEAL